MANMRRKIARRTFPALTRLTYAAHAIGVTPLNLRRALAKAGIEAIKLDGVSNAAIHYDTRILARWCAEHGIPYDPTRDEVSPTIAAPGALTAPRGAAAVPENQESVERQTAIPRDQEMRR